MELNREERSLLVYLESREVDYQGYLDSRNLNAEDHAILKAWNESDFVAFGRVPSDVIAGRKVPLAAFETHWAELSEEAAAEAARLRGERAVRGRSRRGELGEFRRWSRGA